MLKRLTITLLYLLLIFKAFGQSTGIDAVFDKTRSLLLSDTAYATEQSYRLTDDVKYDTDAKGYLERLAADGSWPDINYQNVERSSWKPAWHLYRTMLLIRQYHKDNDARYLNATHLSLKYWIAHDFLCGNWWQNQINIPFAYSSIILMLDHDALPTEIDFLNNVLVSRSKQKAPTGQNKIWQHDIDARIALIYRDETGFAAALKDMQSVISVSVNEGIQPDYSFQQHGPMLQFGNYGLHFINSLLFWMTVSANTPFAFDNAKQKILFDYCSKGINWSIYKGAMDITAMGRQLRNNAAVKRGQNLLTDFNLLKSFDKNNDCKYALDGLTDGCTLTGNKAFWRTDYMVQLKGEHYMMSVKTHGAGVSKVESINSENMKGALLNDGVTLVQQTGNEYRNIEPLWNWAMLPGTTCDTTTNTQTADVFKTSNTCLFTGLVSNGVEGISAMDYNRLGIKAKKSYFMINGMLVCLGAGIETANMKNVVTTVEQSYNAGEVIKDPSFSSFHPWVWHYNTGYFFLGNSPVYKTSVTKRSGTWNAIDGASSNQVLSGSVFTLYVPHSITNTYAYAVKPEIKSDDMNALVQHFPVTVIQNTAQIQAVQSNHILMAVFYEPGLCKLNGIEVKTDKPCMLIYETLPGKRVVWISDPTRSLTTLTITVSGKQILVKLPQGDLVGSTTRIEI